MRENEEKSIVQEEKTEPIADLEEGTLEGKPDQEEEEREEGKNKRYNTWSWLLILIPVFIILLLISCFMLGTLLYNLATIDRYAVQLGNGAQGELELFQIVYDDKTGDIIVEGTTQEDVVAPGTEVHSTLRLENPTNLNLDYVLTCDAGYYNEFRVPIEVKMTDNNGRYIVGSAHKWVSIIELNDLKHRGTVKKGEFHSFNISWRWQYETGREEDDLYDTFLGNVGGNRVPGVIVAFYTDAVTSPSLTPRHFYLHENFFCCWCCYLVWILLIITLIQCFYNWRYRRKLNRAAEDLDRYEELYGPLPDPNSVPDEKDTASEDEPENKTNL